MNNVIEKIAAEIDENFKCIQINFGDIFWNKDIPPEAGWYTIRTNTPIDVLKSAGPPKYKAHINIPETIASTSELCDSGIAILPQLGDEDYIVYNGEAKNLKARAKEHASGHPKTYCLDLSNYKFLQEYRWFFCYSTLFSCVALASKKKDDKLLRLAV